MPRNQDIIGRLIASSYASWRHMTIDTIRQHHPDDRIWLER
jgi:hypothetical protein